MNDFVFESPTKFVVGIGGENKVGELIAELGHCKVLVHFGQSSAKKSGLIGRVELSLQSVGIDYIELGGVRANPDINLVREGYKQARDFGATFVLAIGGGSVIDSAKAIALAFAYEGDVWDLYDSTAAYSKFDEKKIIQIGTILTIPAAGSEGSANSVISNDQAGLKCGFKHQFLRPKFSVLNPKLCSTLPAYQSACGITDMFAHLLERYFGGVTSVPVTDNLNLSLMQTIVSLAPKIMKDPSDTDSQMNLMWSSTLCHNGIAGCGLTEEWTCHALEHELSALDPNIAHGAGLAVVFPAWMDYVCDAGYERFATYGSKVFGLAMGEDEEHDANDAKVAIANQAIAKTREFFASLGMPSTLEQLGLNIDDIPKTLTGLELNRGAEFGFFKKLNLQDAVKIYMSTSQNSR